MSNLIGITSAIPLSGPISEAELDTHHRRGERRTNYEEMGNGIISKHNPAPVNDVVIGIVNVPQSTTLDMRDKPCSVIKLGKPCEKDAVKYCSKCMKDFCGHHIRVFAPGCRECFPNQYT